MSGLVLYRTVFIIIVIMSYANQYEAIPKRACLRIDGDETLLKTGSMVEWESRRMINGVAAGQDLRAMDPIQRSSIEKIKFEHWILYMEIIETQKPELESLDRNCRESSGL